MAFVAQAVDKAVLVKQRSLADTGFVRWSRLSALQDERPFASGPWSPRSLGDLP
jgi:hypothetical protein